MRLIALLALWICARSYAISTQPVTWADMSSIDLTPALESEYGSESNLHYPVINPKAHDLALADADSLISPEFHVPKEIYSSVAFWLKIYTEYSTQQMVLFDQNHPEIIYEVLDFRELSKTARNRIVYEIVSKKRIKKTFALYRAAFQKLAKNKKIKNPSREEAIILERLRLIKHKHSMAELSKNMRIQTGQRDNIVKGLLAAETYFHRIETLFQNTGIPVELSRLSLVESSFNLASTSRVGAVGVWQFMPTTAKSYLTLDKSLHVDERISPLKSSLAAARLLKANFNIFDNWASAVTAYNHGMRGLPKKGDPDSKYEKTLKMFSLCAGGSEVKKPHRSPLGWASKNYYSEFLAILHAEAYRKLFYGEPPVQELQPIAFKRLESKTSAAALAKNLGIKPLEFKMLNPDILNLNTPLPKGFWFAVPAQEDDIAQSLKSSPKKKPFTKKVAYSK